MFYSVWYKNTNFIKLVDAPREKENVIFSPRPVFFEELSLLGFSSHFQIRNEGNAPICWASNRQYFYKGDIIAKVISGDIFSSPALEFDSSKHKVLYGINIEKQNEINYQLLFSLENEAKDFIKRVQRLYQTKYDSFVVAFSGGKDSQVVLDLVTKTLDPDSYIVVFTDTGMELPCTYDTVNETKNFYSKLFDGFTMITAGSEESAIEQWEKFGPPSRFSRWCCSVRKTAPFTMIMKTYLGTKKQPKSVVFEGIRADESSRREKYKRIAAGVKHVNILNARPIFSWSDTEVYMYILKNNISINPAYRNGLSRVGCNICPFASAWSETLISILYPEVTAPYIEQVKKMAKNLGISNQEKINEYISTGNWKKNAGGRGLDLDKTRLDIISKVPILEAVLTDEKSDWKKWLSTLGSFIYSKTGQGFSGEIIMSGSILKFQIEKKDNKSIFRFFETDSHVSEARQISKVLTKVAFCERCGVCEAECPTGALVIRKNIFLVDDNVCIKCGNCTDINKDGCIIASRRKLSEGGLTNMSSTRTSGLDKYSTFGLRDIWIESFFEEFDDFFVNYGGLGSKQIVAVIAWLREAELVDLNVKKASDFAKSVKKLFELNKFYAKQIIWINLCFNSPIVNIYVNSTLPNTAYSKNDLKAIVHDFFPRLSEGTISNPVDALFNMFSNSCFGCSSEEEPYLNDNLKMGIYVRAENKPHIIRKGTSNISNIALLYLLYKKAEFDGKYEYTVSDFYEYGDFGPKEIFNVEKEAFTSSLNALEEQGFISVDLLSGLDNIHLFPTLKSKDIISKFLNGRRI